MSTFSAVSKKGKSLLPVSRIENAIFLIRDNKVMPDQDLAALYGVETRVLAQAVKRNHDRFPEDFMFRFSKDEYANLKSQIVISSWGGRRTRPYAFTEQGVLERSIGTFGTRVAASQPRRYLTGRLTYAYGIDII